MTAFSTLREYHTGGRASYLNIFTEIFDSPGAGHCAIKFDIDTLSLDDHSYLTLCKSSSEKMGGTDPIQPAVLSEGKKKDYLLRRPTAC